MSTTEVNSRKMRLAALSRHRDPADSELIDARRDLRASKLVQYVESTLAEFPPLTRQQLDSVGALLTAGRDDSRP